MHGIIVPCDLFFVTCKDWKMLFQIDVDIFQRLLQTFR